MKLNLQPLIQMPTLNGNRLILIDTSGLRNVSLSEKNRNIYCIDSSNEIVWQINPMIPPKSETDCFVSLNSVGGKFLADRFFGDEFEIDFITGNAISTGWHK